MKRKKSFLIHATALAIGLALVSSASEEGLVAHFTFDNAARFGYDSVRQAEIGTIHSFTNYNSASAAAAPVSCEAPVGQGMQTAGGWWWNSYMQVPGSSFGSAQGIPCGNQAVTYTLWVKPARGWQTSSNLGVGTSCLLLRHAASGHEWYQSYDHENIYIVKDGSLPKIAFAVGEWTAAAATASYTLPAAFDGDWHFIAATYANRTLVLYWDGRKVAETALTQNVGVPDNSPLFVGSVTAGYDAYCRDRYCGAVDDLKVYDRALDGDEILAAYDAVMNPPVPAVPVTADASVADFPRLAGETDDAPRIQRAIDATTGGVLYLPRGGYDIASTLLVTNRCSLLMHKSATLKAVATMDYVVRVRNGGVSANLDFLCFLQGGAIDGNGLASCLFLEGCQRQSLDDIKILNGTTYGLHVGGDAEEVVAKGLYFLCRKHGLAGNTAMVIQGDGGHYTDIHILDWTTGAVVRGRSNRLTRFHAWGGSLPPANAGDIPEMLPGSTSFRIEGDSTTLRDCYADTAQTGFAIHDASNVRILGCSYYNNSDYGLNDLTILRQTGSCGALLVANCVFTRSGTSERITVYDGNGDVTWRDIIYGGDWSGIVRPGRD